MVGTKVTRCTVKNGPDAGAFYYVETKRNWGKPSYAVESDSLGWHANPTAARKHAEANGWVYATNRRGDRTLVHHTAVRHYA